MTQDKRSLFSHAFIAMMAYCGLVWLFTVAFILGWPWEKSSQWKPEFRLAAICADQEPCGIAYGDLEKARAQGTVTEIP